MRLANSTMIPLLSQPVVGMAGFAWSGGVTVAVCGGNRNTQTDNDQSLNQGL
jgi:hypothetical protein